MKDLIPSINDLVLGLQDSDLVPHVPRRIQRAVDEQLGRGLVRAARAQADAYVAETRVEGAAYLARMGMRRVAELSVEEVRYTAQTLAAEGRYRAIGDAFTALVANEVIKLGRER